MQLAVANEKRGSALPGRVDTLYKSADLAALNSQHLQSPSIQARYKHNTTHRIFSYGWGSRQQEPAQAQQHKVAKIERCYYIHHTFRVKKNLYLLNSLPPANSYILHTPHNQRLDPTHTTALTHDTHIASQQWSRDTHTMPIHPLNIKD
jgi:hypothetical protein